MKKLYTIAVLAITAAALLAAGCTATKQGTQYISVDTTQECTAAFEQRVKIKKTIHLTDSVLLGNISKVLYRNGNLYVWDKSAQSILCYNDEGALLFRICTVGRGPGEYSGISNFWLGGRKNTLTIIAPEKKLLEYSATTGKLLSSRPITAQTIMFTDGAELADGSAALGIVGPHHNLAVSSPDTTIYHIPFNMGRDFAFMEKAFAQDGEEMLFVHGMSNNIYSVSPDTTTVKYIADFKGLELPDSEYLQRTPQEIQKIHDTRTVATRIDNLTASTNHITFSYWLMHPNKELETRYVLYTKKTGEIISINGNGLFPVRDAIGDTFISILDKNDGECNPDIVMWELARTPKHHTNNNH